MLLLAAVALAIVTLPLSGGSFSELGATRLRFVWAIFAALTLQVVILSVWPDGSPALHRILHVGSYGLATVFLVANGRVHGMWVVAVGMSLNLVAIVANNGVMPASGKAMRAAGRVASHGFMNSTAVAHPRLLFLGDVLAVPKPWPLHNVYSIGDVCIAIGAFVVIHALAHAQWNERSELSGTGGRVRPT